MTTTSGGERKQVSILFSDLSGYTSLSEKLDPEEVHDLMQHIFSGTTRIIAKYEGYINKFLGDGVMVLFGIPQVHEDDAVRAIKAAQEIHKYVADLSPQYISKTGRALAMHTGISTGLVVSYDTQKETEKERVLGDTINLASRLSSLAQVGEIVVSATTYQQAEHFFQLQPLELVMVKGKEEPVHAFRVVSVKEKPVTVHRLTGMRANLIGREKELNVLKEAARKLVEKREGSIITISGEAGIGKSRLVEELKAILDLNQIQWLEGHAYAYAQNIPYFPLIDLLNRTLNIREDEDKEKTRYKLETGLALLNLNSKEITPYLGSLYGLSYPATENIEPELWKYRLYNAVKEIVSFFTREKPAIVCLEDLHWFDPSSTELFRTILEQLKSSTLFICTFRPSFNLYNDREAADLGEIHHAIQVKDLSSLEAEEMVRVLLKADNIPPELRQYLMEKTEGNPFYLEEVINSLIETNTLVPDDSSWKLIQSISEIIVPPNIEGVISAKLDRLEVELKRVLQEASVIGGVFLFKILNMITESRDMLEDNLSGLENADLIKIKALEPDLEYIFKHALIRDVAYNGMLKKDRQRIHERIGQVIEEIFVDRLSDVYETLAYHYKQTDSIYKALEYLMRSADKAVHKYSVEEAHQFYQDAYNLLMKKSEMSKMDSLLLFKLINKWNWVYLLRADFKNWDRLLQTHESYLQVIDDKAEKGIYYGWFCFVGVNRLRYHEAYQYGCKAINFAQESQNLEAICLANSFLAFASVGNGLVDEAVDQAKKASRAAIGLGDNPSNTLLINLALESLGMMYFQKGETQNLFMHGSHLIETGRRQDNIRTESVGHLMMGYGHCNKGNYLSACESFQKACSLSIDPWFSIFTKWFFSQALVRNGKFKEARVPLLEIINFSEKFGFETIGSMAEFYIGAIEIIEGKFTKGMRQMLEIREKWKRSCKYNYAIAEYFFGIIYLKIIIEKRQFNLRTIIKNVSFLRHSLFANRKARMHLKEAIRIREEMQAMAVLADSYFELGRLNQIEKNPGDARQCFIEASKIYEQMGADFSLSKVNEAMNDIHP